MFAHYPSYSAKVFCQLFVAAMWIVIAFSPVFSQDLPKNPDRGAKVGNAYAVGDFETINTTNGNMILNFPLASLPAGRGGVGGGISLVYNSKIWDMKSEKIEDTRGSPYPPFFDKTVIDVSTTGGWKLSTGEILIEQEDRRNQFLPNWPSCPGDLTDQMTYVHKVRVVLPDGSKHEMLPTGYNDTPMIGDGFYKVATDGWIENCGGSRSRTGHAMVYHSIDGSFLRLEYSYDNDEVAYNNTWVLYFPDGKKYESSTGRLFDRNGNYVTMTYNSVSDQLGRTVSISNSGDDTFVTYDGVGGEDIVWTIKWKYIAISKSYESCEAHRCTSPYFRSGLQGPLKVVDRIVQPDEMGENREYVFHYNAPDYQGVGHEWVESEGWGEISSIDLPSGATVSYDWVMDGEDGPTQFFLTPTILKNYPETKTLTYKLEYDDWEAQSPATATETWTYNIENTTSSVTGPDGGVTTDLFDTTDGGGLTLPWSTGLSIRNVGPNGTMVEKIWAQNNPTGFSGPGLSFNTYVDMELTSIKNAAGSYTLTAIKDFTYDKNGNVTEVREYDWVPYCDVPRSVTYCSGLPTGLPSGASTNLRRITKTEFYNDAPTASSSTYTDQDSYHLASSKRLLRLAKSTTVQDASEATKARSEITYDYTNYDSSNTKGGNPTVTRTWDSTKNTVTNPLTDSNSIKTQATYNDHGMPITTTDANSIVTQITYGNVTVGGNSVTGPYPTLTVAAHGTGLARTSSAVYDFYTGVVSSATDEDNDLTNVSIYDPLGRPTTVKSAYGTALESWTQTTYDDEERRVIAKSDLATAGDGKKVAIQHFDALGRVRLVRTLEDASTEDPEVEADGIKVQTRYKIASSFNYQLQSNPYRADESDEETDPTMGWTLSKSWTNGSRSEVHTISGAGLPDEGFDGPNSSSTGVVSTDIDANRTLVTDQAGKQKISKTNALAHLTDVWEITAQDASTVGITFPSTSIAYGYQTSYEYDILNNLLLVDQSEQEREFSYSSLSRLLSAENPESGTIAFEYDNNSNLTEKTDARGVVTTYSYDQLNRVTDRVYAAPNPTPTNYQTTPNVEYTYGTTAPKVGKLVKVESTVSTTEYTAFDILGRVTASKQTTDGGVTGGYTSGYTYNLSGVLIEQTYPNGRKVVNELDVSGDLARVKSRKNSGQAYWNYANHFTYNAAGAVTSMQLGNGRWESTGFNSRLQPTQIALGATQGTTNLLDLDYTYGMTANNGNVLSQTITVPTVDANTGFTAVQTYSYDSLNRVQQAYERPNGWTENNCTSDPEKCWKQTFTFDRYGNRRFVESNTTMPSSFTNQALTNPTISTTNNQLTSTGWSYDSSGNTARDPENRKFIYDAENKQVKVQTVDSNGNPTGTIGEYFYDGDGKRVKKYVPSTGETTVFVYDATAKLIEEYSTFVATENEAKVAYLTNDHLGSPRINTDANGAVTTRHDYHPFGEEIATAQRTPGFSYNDDTVRKQFTGYERDDETELDFAQARMYSKALGRFTQCDPIIISKEHPPSPQRWNLYLYVINNPLRLVDKDGEKPRTVNIFLGIKVSPGNLTPEGMKQWTDLKKNAPKGVKVNIYTLDDGTATAEQFIKSISTENTTTVYFGHAYGNDTMSQGKGGVGLEFHDSQISQRDQVPGSAGKTVGLDNVDAKGDSIGIFACDSGKTFDNLRSSKGTALVSMQNGPDSTSGLDAAQQTSLEFAKTAIQGSTPQASRDSAQAVFFANRHTGTANLDNPGVSIRKLER